MNGMVKTVYLKTDVGQDREVRLTLPDDVPVGPAEITLIVTPVVEKSLPTLGEFAESEFFGMWKDREDVGAGSDFARKLREEGWKRGA
jgi:hypothetical protein